MTSQPARQTAPPRKDDLLNDRASDALTDLRRAFCGIYEAQARSVESEADLITALSNAVWLTRFAGRVLNSAVVAYAQGGYNPEADTNSNAMAREALALLDNGGIPDPDLCEALLQAVLCTRSAASATLTAQRQVTNPRA